MNLLPIISVINLTERLPDQEVGVGIRAINRQIVEDLLPVWGAGRRLEWVPRTPDFSLNSDSDADARIILFEPVQWPMLAWSRGHRYRHAWRPEIQPDPSAVRANCPESANQMAVTLPTSVQKWVRFWAMEP